MPINLVLFYYSKWCTLRWESRVNLPYMYTLICDSRVVVINDACNQSTNTIQLFLFLLSSFLHWEKYKKIIQRAFVLLFFFSSLFELCFPWLTAICSTLKKETRNWRSFFCFKTQCCYMPFRGWWIISFTRPKENNISDIIRSIRYTLSIHSTLLHEFFKFSEKNIISFAFDIWRSNFLSIQFV